MMKQITTEEGFSLIERYLNKSLKGLDINDKTATYKSLMKDHKHACHFEASVTDDPHPASNRLGRLFDILKPEIEHLSEAPIYYYVLILRTPVAQLQMNELDALAAFIDTDEDIEKDWTLETVEGTLPTIKMHIIVVMP